jgi:hypothetical protein
LLQGSKDEDLFNNIRATKSKDIAYMEEYELDYSMRMASVPGTSFAPDKKTSLTSHAAPEFNKKPSGEYCAF